MVVYRWYIHGLHEYVNATSVAVAFFATLGRHSSRPDLTAPSLERSLSTSTKFVRLAYSPFVYTLLYLRQTFPYLTDIITLRVTSLSK